MRPRTESPSRKLLLALAAGVLLLPSCETLPPPGPETPLLEGLARYGATTVEAPEPAPATGAPEIVVVKDRHAIHGAITRERGPLMRVRRENRGVVAFLLQKGYRLVGCEAPYGPLPDDDGPSRAHRAAVRRALRIGDVLDRITVYQPIRYEEEFPSLEVVGMEDTELYGKDAGRLEQIQKLRHTAGRSDLPRARRQETVATMMKLMRAISANVDARGRAAACNLLEHMWLWEHDRAALVIGGAHAPAAVRALRRAGVRVILFECASYKDR